MIIKSLFENRSHPGTGDPALIKLLGQGNASSSGINVTTDRALQNSAVFSCIRVLAETIASMPLILYERIQAGTSHKQRAFNHPLYRLLHDAPNPLMTRSEFFEAIMIHLNFHGNAYAELVSDTSGQVVEIWPWPGDKVRVELEMPILRYFFKTTSGEVEVPAARVVHFRALASNGIKGLSPIAAARESIALGLAAQEYGARFFSQDSNPGGYLAHPGKLGDPARENIKKSWEEAHTGLTQAHRVAVLEEGLTWNQTSINPEDAQFLETRKFQISDIARIFRVPAHLIGDLERATFSNIEQLGIDFLTHTLRPWLIRLESQIARSVILPSEQSRYFPEFLVDAFLRGDSKTRWEVYQTGLQNGVLSPNEVRDRENMNPRDGGDIYYDPANITGKKPGDTQDEDDNNDNPSGSNGSTNNRIAELIKV